MSTELSTELETHGRIDVVLRTYFAVLRLIPRTHNKQRILLYFSVTSTDMLAGPDDIVGTSHRFPNRYRGNGYANWYPSNSPINRISMVKTIATIH
jgi:hypothetical protein